MGWQITFNGTKRDITPKERQAEIDAARKAETQPPSIWQPGIGTSVNVDELSPDDVKGLAERHGVKWATVYDTALYDDIDAFLDVVNVCATHAGVEPPTPTDMRAFMELYRDGWEFTPDIADAPMENGFPTAPGETEPGSSSTSPGTTDGLPKSHDDSQLATS